jgi:hypothetical protein
VFDKDKELPCKLFSGSKDTSGYGKLWDAARKRTVGAHRIAYERHYGVTLSSDQHVLHKCDNPPCIEVTHLFLGSNADNILDKVSKGRQAKGPDDADVELCRALYTGKWGEQTELARRFNVKPSTISRWLNGHFRKSLIG